MLLAMCLETAALAGNPAVDSGEKVSIVNGFPVVDVWMNGRGPFRMLIDTGTSSCALSPKAARTAGLAFDSRVHLANISGEHLVPAARATRVRVGPIEAEGIEVLAQTIDAARRLDSKVDGLLGQSFLSRRPYLIDYRRRRIWFGEAATRQASRLGPAVHAESAYGRMVLPVEIEHGVRPWRLVLDSGAASLIVQCSTRCPHLSEVDAGARVITNSGERPARQGLLRRVQVGAVSMSRAPAVLVEAAPMSNQEDGVLPAAWFSAIYVDSGRGLVRLAKGLSPSYPK